MLAREFCRVHGVPGGTALTGPGYTPLVSITGSEPGSSQWYTNGVRVKEKDKSHNLQEMKSPFRK